MLFWKPISFRICSKPLDIGNNKNEVPKWHSMRCSVEPRYQIYVKIYWYLSFTNNIRKNLDNKYNKKLFYYVNKSATDALKTVSNRKFKIVIQKNIGKTQVAQKNY